MLSVQAAESPGNEHECSTEACARWTGVTSRGPRGYGVQFDGCPGCLLSETATPLRTPYEYVRAWKCGIMPYGGGLESQPLIYREVLTFLASCEAEREAKEAAKMRGESNKMKSQAGAAGRHRTFGG